MSTAAYIASDETPTRPAPPALRVRARGGERLVLRALQRLLGAGLSLAALGLWLMPVGNETTTELLSKLMVTLVLGFAGAGFWQAGAPMPSPRLEIDVVRREVRLVRWQGKTRTFVTRRRFRDLGSASFDARDVQLWDKDGQLLAELTLPDTKTVNSLRRGLADSGVVPALAA